ncbi:hypothetical protein VTK26DRAFT_7008 [Humicola hyalothermophila]
MPSARKRSSAAAQLDNGTPNWSKRLRTPDIVILSDDDGFEQPAPATTRGSGNRAMAGDDNPRTLTILGQLQQDALFDFKDEICSELDTLQPPTEIDESYRESSASDADVEASVDSVSGEHEPLRNALRRWVENGKTSRLANHLYYRLESRYDERNFPPRSFLHRDRVIVETLGRLSRSLSLDVFLALLDREDSPSPSYLVRDLFDLEGGKLASDIPLDERNWLHARLSLAQVSPPMAEVAVLLVPSDGVVDFLMSHFSPTPGLVGRGYHQTQDIQQLVDHFTTRILKQKRGNFSRLLPVFRDLCTRVWQLDESKGLAVLPIPLVEKILKTLLHAQDWVFFEEASCHIGPFPLPKFFSWVSQQVKHGMVAIGDIEKGLLHATLACPITSERISTAFSLFGLCEKRGGAFLRQLTTTIIESIGRHPLCFVDGYGLAPWVKRCLGPETLMSM